MFSWISWPQLCRAIPSAAVTRPAVGPVDTPTPPSHRSAVSKPRKADEPQAAYAATKPSKAPAGPRFANLGKVRANNAKLIQVHSKVLLKLAQ